MTYTDFVEDNRVQTAVRRAMTADEVDRFLQATAAGKKYEVGTPGERVVIYRMFLETGLRPGELFSLTPSQIDFESGCLMMASKTKGLDMLPIRANLLELLWKRIKILRIGPHERVFRHSRCQVLDAFYRDLHSAGIERMGRDGRIIDLYSLRQTFGMTLAMAGVPLLTVQRLMRHERVNQTIRLYIDVESMDEHQALALLSK